MKSTITPTNVAAEINRLHNGIVGALRNTVTDAIEIGRLLTEHKASLAHGEWLPWLEANLSFDDRTARRYASLYENRAKLDSVSNLNDAYRLLSKPREHKPADKDSSRADGRAAGKRLLDKLPAGLTADQREQYAMGIAECVAAWLYLLRMERGDFAPKQATETAPPITVKVLALTAPAPPRAVEVQVVKPAKPVKPATNGHRHNHARSTLHIKE